MKETLRELCKSIKDPNLPNNSYELFILEELVSFGKCFSFLLVCKNPAIGKQSKFKKTYHITDSISTDEGLDLCYKHFSTELTKYLNTQSHLAYDQSSDSK